MSSFENLRVVDNFYQTSLFFPMPRRFEVVGELVHSAFENLVILYWT